MRVKEWRNLFECDASTHEQAMSVLLEQVKQADSQGAAKVVISHCFLDGGSESDSERPLSVGGADKISPKLFEGFAYTALGHLHGPQYKGSEHIRYSGSILKYSFSEQHQNKSVTLVELDETGTAKVELLPLKPLRNVRIIEGMLNELLTQGADDPHKDDYLMVRLLDTHAILDPMGKLRSVYPNVLHLERTGLMAKTDQLAVRSDQIKKGELEMFSDFFNQVSGSSMSEQQQALMVDIVDKLHKAEDEQ